MLLLSFQLVCIHCALAKVPEAVLQSNLDFPRVRGGEGDLNVSFCHFGVFNSVSLCNQK